MQAAGIVIFESVFDIFKAMTSKNLALKNIMDFTS
jgi:hypothetical protein